MTKDVKFKYLNHRGVLEEREIKFECLEFIKDPGYGYQSGWFISGECYKKAARRSFSLNRIIMNEDHESVPRFYKLLELDNRE